MYATVPNAIAINAAATTTVITDENSSIVGLGVGVAVDLGVAVGVALVVGFGVVVKGDGVTTGCVVG